MQKGRAEQLGLLVCVHVIVSVGELETGDVTGPVLNFEVGFKNLNVHEFALRGTGAVGTGEVEGKITVVSQNKAVHLEQHWKYTSPIVSIRSKTTDIGERL